MTCSESRLAVEIIPHARHVEDRTLAAEGAHHHLVRIGQNADVVRVVLADHQVAAGAVAAVDRSEEHTSELQSLMRISYAVFCLKKKIKQQSETPYKTTRLKTTIQHVTQYHTIENEDN